MWLKKPASLFDEGTYVFQNKTYTFFIKKRFLQKQCTLQMEQFYSYVADC